MGQKTNPIGFRIGINKKWPATWFANSRKEYIEKFYEDAKIENYLLKRLSNAMVSKIEISRKGDNVKITIHTARPGVVIGKKGVEIEKIRHELLTLLKMQNSESYSKLNIDVKEIKRAELDARLIGLDIAYQIKNRISHRRAMKRAISKAMRSGAVGIKIKCSGRLHGAEIARSEEYRYGRTPLHTLRSDIDYALTEANTKYGIIGIKVWVCKGEILGKGKG
ncbi:MAG: 30S ribosomal protein S3 [Candidatus Cloacimonetes bacterium]|nr:30S ribosomal protein S3 [Candidatus Cloacimonadota bacterium]